MLNTSMAYQLIKMTGIDYYYYTDKFVYVTSCYCFQGQFSIAKSIHLLDTFRFVRIEDLSTQDRASYKIRGK